MRAEFVRQNGQLTIKEGVLKGPTIGGTIEGSIDYPGNQVRMSGTFVPMYGLNNISVRFRSSDCSLAAAAMKALFGLTYEVVGTPDKPTLRVNPISPIAAGGHPENLGLQYRQAEQLGRASRNNYRALTSVPQRRYHQERDHAENDGDQRIDEQRIVAVRDVVDQTAAP